MIEKNKIKQRQTIFLKFQEPQSQNEGGFQYCNQIKYNNK